MKPIEDGKYQFDSGRVIEPNRGYVGLNHEGDVSEGYDGSFYMDGSDHYMTLSAAECVELAELMIAQWQAFRDKWAQSA